MYVCVCVLTGPVLCVCGVCVCVCVCVSEHRCGSADRSQTEAGSAVRFCRYAGKHTRLLLKHSQISQAAAPASYSLTQLIMC